MSKDKIHLHYNGKCTVVLFRQLLNLLLFLFSQSVKDLNHLLRRMFRVISFCFYGSMQRYDNNLNAANILTPFCLL